MWIGIRRVPWHRSAIEIVSALCNGSTARSLLEVNLVIVGVHVIPRITWFGSLLHPSRVISVHGPDLLPSSGLVEGLNQLVNLVSITSSKSLRMPFGN